jgi:carbon storage regulator
MLVISRRLNEGIVIGSISDKPITVFVVEIRGDKVRLGIDVPPEIPVHRSEVYEAMRREVWQDRELPQD